MTPNIIGIKELQNNLKKVQDKVSKGGYFIVVSRSRPVFRIFPPAKESSLEDSLRGAGRYPEEFVQEMATAEADIQNNRVYQIDSLDELLPRKNKK